MMTRIEPTSLFAGSTNMGHIGLLRSDGSVHTLCNFFLKEFRAVDPTEPREVRECRVCRKSWNKLTSYGEHIIAHGSMTLPIRTRWAAQIEYTVRRD